MKERKKRKNEKFSSWMLLLIRNKKKRLAGIIIIIIAGGQARVSLILKNIYGTVHKGRLGDHHKRKLLDLSENSYKRKLLDLSEIKIATIITQAKIKFIHLFLIIVTFSPCISLTSTIYLKGRKLIFTVSRN